MWPLLLSSSCAIGPTARPSMVARPPPNVYAPAVDALAIAVSNAWRLTGNATKPRNASTCALSAILTVQSNSILKYRI